MIGDKTAAGQLADNVAAVGQSRAGEISLGNHAAVRAIQSAHRHTRTGKLAFRIKNIAERRHQRLSIIRGYRAVNAGQPQQGIFIVKSKVIL